MKKRVLFLLVVSFLAFKQDRERNYFKPTFNYNAISRVKPIPVPFDDLIPSDTIYACYTTNSFPHAYYREVFTNVCNAGECLPVWLFMYWSAGGAYLGYSLKEDNILTKEQHVPFTEDDYRKLHDLLDLPQSLLKDYEIKASETAEEDPDQAAARARKSSEFGKYAYRKPLLGENLTGAWTVIGLDTTRFDGLTTATDKEVKLFVVKGALYTTHTLWHTVYGPTRDSIRSRSLRYASPQFLDTLLYSPSPEDRQYALRILNQLDPAVTAPRLPRLGSYLLSPDFLLKENTLRTLLASRHSEPVLQQTLANVFSEADFGTKQMILDNLGRYSSFSPELVRVLIRNLARENAFLIQKTLKLLDRKATIDLASKRLLADLLANENRYIATLAFTYLSAQKNNEPEIEAKLRSFSATGNAR